MPVPMLDVSRQHQQIREELRDAMDRVVDSSQFVLGPEVEAFEREVADRCGVRHAVGLSSGTDALLVALQAVGVGEGDEVIVPAFTFFASAGSVWRLGARPVFVDIDPATLNVDPAAAEAAVTPRTRAIMPVHLFGQCAAMGSILELARGHDLAVVEDAAQALGARDHDRVAGSMGRVGALSFYPTKNLGGFGDAGMCVTDDEHVAQRIRQLRVHGQTDAYHHAVVGGNFRIDALQAAMLRVKLRHLKAYTRGRRTAAERYFEMLDGLPITLPTTGEGRFHVYNQFTIRAPRREEMMEHLRTRGIGCKVYYPLPLHLQPCFASVGYEPGACPEAERACREVLSLPMYPELRADQQSEVAEALLSFFERLGEEGRMV